MSHKGDGQSVVTRRTRAIELPSGKSIELSQLTLKDYTALREAACSEYKRNLIETYTRNLDLMPEEMRSVAVKEVFKRAESITPDDLPKKKAWVAKKDESGQFVRNDGEPFYHDGVQQVINTGDAMPVEEPIDYAGWWASNTSIGRIHTLWYSMRHCNGQQGTTLEEMFSMFQDDAAARDAANVVGELSEQRLENRQPPQPAANK